MKLLDGLENIGDSYDGGSSYSPPPSAPPPSAPPKPGYTAPPPSYAPYRNPLLPPSPSYNLDYDLIDDIRIQPVARPSKPYTAPSIDWEYKKKVAEEQAKESQRKANIAKLARAKKPRPNQTFLSWVKENGIWIGDTSAEAEARSKFQSMLPLSVIAPPLDSPRPTTPPLPSTYPASPSTVSRPVYDVSTGLYAPSGAPGVVTPEESPRKKAVSNVQEVIQKARDVSRKQETISRTPEASAKFERSSALVKETADSAEGYIDEAGALIDVIGTVNWASDYFGAEKTEKTKLEEKPKGVKAKASIFGISSPLEAISKIGSGLIDIPSNAVSSMVDQAKTKAKEGISEALGLLSNISTGESPEQIKIRAKFERDIARKEEYARGSPVGDAAVSEFREEIRKRLKEATGLEPDPLLTKRLAIEGASELRNYVISENERRAAEGKREINPAELYNNKSVLEKVLGRKLKENAASILPGTQAQEYWDAKREVARLTARKDQISRQIRFTQDSNPDLESQLQKINKQIKKQQQYADKLFNAPPESSFLLKDPRSMAAQFASTSESWAGVLGK